MQNSTGQRSASSPPRNPGSATVPITLERQRLVDPDVNKIGPSLAGVVGRRSGTAAGYDYSAAMKNADITWDDNTLDMFLAGPGNFVHGTKMFLSVPNRADRQNIIAYLATLKGH